MAGLLLSGQAPPAAVSPVALVKAQVSPFTSDGAGGFSGEAWRQLVSDAAGAQFTMVGEQHGSGDIARLEAALQQELIRGGYTHAALEVGPISTEFAERLIRAGKGELQHFIARPGHGFTIPFLFFSEEAQMAAAMVESSPDKRQALFGLDQEFVGSAPVLVGELKRLANTPAQRQAVSDFEALAAKDPMIIGTIGDGDLARLQAAFAGNELGSNIVEAIGTSARIYRPFISRIGSGYAANLDRETYMKRNFVRQFEDARKRNGTAPKVFLKFGGFHAMRGMSGTNVPALGNFLAEWGLPQGYRMVNMMVDCIGGKAMNPQTNMDSPCESYFDKSSVIYQAVADGPALQIVDLRALRPQLGKLKDADEQTRKIILAFDYYVVVKGGRAATPLGKPAA